MLTIKGIISFPTLFTPKVAKGADQAKFSLQVLLPPTDPQVPAIQAAVEQAKKDAFPSGYTGADECFAEYDSKYMGKDYYDPRFSGYWVFSCSAKADDRPSVVDINRQEVINPGDVFSGQVVYVSANISGYTKGRGGIGGWLNGVMITNEEPPMGRLDGKPSVDQMFASIPGGAAPAAQPAMPTPPTPPAPTQAAPQYEMTAAANGLTREAYHASGWTDDMLIQKGMMVLAGGATPSFA